MSSATTESQNLSTGTSSVVSAKEQIKIDKPKVIILCVEGVTTSKSYWKDILEPIIRDNAERCLNEQWNSVETVDVLTLVYEQLYMDDINKKQEFDDEDSKTILQSISKQNKKTSIKLVCRHLNKMLDEKRFTDDIHSLMILIWFYCWQKHSLKTHIYDDVKRMLEMWKHAKVQIVTFGNGKMIAHEMIFAMSNIGNCHQYISQFFSSNVIGSYFRPASYQVIAKTLKVENEEMVFLSDNPRALKAAKRSGCEVILVIRRHNQSYLRSEICAKYPCIETFDQIELVYNDL